MKREEERVGELRRECEEREKEAVDNYLFYMSLVFLKPVVLKLGHGQNLWKALQFTDTWGLVSVVLA